ncbi:MAG: lipid A deacylase LpxR family protein [Pseudomonadota bacterium]|nr:lipid A deacylase LpxR family protein [Pseudomonadota bacterium]
MKFKFLLLVCACVMHAHAVFANENEPTFEEKIPQELKEKRERFFTAIFENDLFAGQDANYTNGVLFTYYDTDFDVPRSVREFVDFSKFFHIDELTSVAYSLGHNLYTPKDITLKTPDPKDRPYAAFLYGTIGLSTISGDHINNLDLTLGLVGPSALGEPIQEEVHSFVDTRDPAGWDHQLKDEPALMLSYQRRWPEKYAGNIGPFYFRTAPYWGATLGNVYTYGALGSTFQLTPQKYKWQAMPLRVKPSIPGTGYFNVPDHAFAWSAFAGFEGRAVARNLFLDGNSYQDSPSVSKKTYVGDANVGLSLIFGRVRTSFTINWRSREFDGGASATFGALSVGYRL